MSEAPIFPVPPGRDPAAEGPARDLRRTLEQLEWSWRAQRSRLRQIEALRAENLGLRQTIADLEDAVARAQAQDSARAQEAAALHERLSAQTNELSAWKAAVEASSERAKELDDALQEHRGTLRTVFDERGALAGRLDWLEQRYRRAARAQRAFAGFVSWLQDLPGYLGLVFALPAALRSARLRPRAALQALRHIALVRRSGLFDAAFYRRGNWDVALLAANPVTHYVLQGWRDGRDPSPSFSTRHYLATYPDVASAQICPLVHYALWGQAQGRSATPRGVGSEAGPPSAPSQVSRSADGVVDLYAIRPDDAVKAEAEAGAAFFERYRLLSERPDFAGAVAAINAVEPTIKRAGPNDTPDATIIIPVYKQLAYTLNCLHSVLQHQSRFTTEIIVMDDNSPDESRLYLPQIPWVRVERNPENLGYLRNCNRGAGLARSRYIVHLNNDTRVVEGWLDELLGHFELHGEAGLVGSKLLYPDGTLQEAGGIVWQDGSAWNYGRNDDPNKPEYCYARHVDYCSAASVAIPRSLWNELGGFDDLYAPAYCEDSDLAFRVRHHARRQVWYQPLSRVIHYEGVSSGRDLTQGVKAYQVANGKKFFNRWQGPLSSHRPNAVDPHFERDRGLTKRAMVIEPTTPTPDQDAGSNTVVNTCRVLQMLGYKVTFVPEDNMLYQPRYTRPLQRMGIECSYVPFDWTLEDHLKRRGRDYDLVYIFRPDATYKHLGKLREHAPQAPLVFHNMDLHYLRMERQARIEGKPELLAAAAEMKTRELEVIRRVDCTVTHTDVEERMLRAEVPEARMLVYPYMIDVIGTKAPYEARADVMFLGGYNHTPNADAVLWFAREILPDIQKQLGAVRLYAVGANPSAALLKLHGDSVVVTGRVDDLQPYFDRCRVFVAPLRYGAGVKGKVASAFAHGLPSVITSIAAEGMGLTDGQQTLVADDPRGFARQVVRLYEDRQLWTTIQQSALAFAQDTYSIEGMGVRKMEEVIRIASAGHAGNRS